MRKYLPLVLLLTAFAASSAAAQEVVECSSSCTDGQVLVAYADGNSTTCVCTEPAEMDPTVPDPSVQEGVINEGT